MEPRYTEEQWREIARIERLSGPDRYIPSDAARKRVYAPHFRVGEFYLAWRPEPKSDDFVGPVYMDCWVYEATSGVVIAYTDSRIFALQDARRVLALVPEERLNVLLAQGRQRTSEKQAKNEAYAAIARAKAAPKVRKVGRRASAVFAASKGKCHYCGTELEIDGKWHIEHKFPRALFGGSEQANLVAACVPCNLSKRDKTDLEFRALRGEVSEIHGASLNC